MSQSKLWEVVRASGASELALGKPVTNYSEWLRLLVGRSLAFSQPSSTDGVCDYLVLGVGLGQLDPDPDARARIRAAVEADFNVLVQLSEHYTQQIHSKDPIGSPERFLQSYAVLAMLRLPERDEDWRVTDEGLTIVNWGLMQGKPWFDWNSEALNAQRRKSLEKCGSPTSAGSAKVSGGGTAPQVNSAKAAIARDPNLQNSTVGSHRVSGSGHGLARTEPKPASESRFNWKKIDWMTVVAIVASILALAMVVVVVRPWFGSKESVVPTATSETPIAPSGGATSNGKTGPVSKVKDQK